MEPINEREHPELTNTSNEDGVLSENSLRQLSKGLARLIPKDCEDIDKTTQNHVQSLHQNLLRTAGSTGFSPKHGAAALNSLCGLLEQCSTSSVPQFRALCSDASSWTRAFQIFLQQSESNKAKPIRRLFLTLRDLLLKHSIGEEKRTLIQHVVASTAGAICKEQNIASIKPAIQALEHFLLKKIVNASDVVFIAAQKAGKPQTTKQGQQSFTAMEPEKIPLSPAQQIESIEDFALRVLEWVQYPDCAPAAGRLLSTFFQSLELDQGKPASSTLGSQQPLWISPVKQALKRHSSLLEVYEHHILPKLLRLSAADTSAFLKTLPFDDIQRGNIGTHEVADIQLCLLAARIGAGSNLVTTEPEYTGNLQENRENPDSKKSEEETGVMNASASKQSVWVDSERLGMNLLGHAASNVRIAALSLLVSASNSTKPFSRQVFDRLRVCLPLFQVEVNPKPRNEFITLMKRFCTRLRGATISILRSGHELAAKDHNVEGVMGDTIPRNRDHTSAREESLISHLAFRRWYMAFLLDELRPTASYQSHITALKILHALFDEEYTGRSSLSKINLEYFDALVDETPSGMHLRPLTDLLMDPFDDVRQAAAEVLEIDLLFNLVPAFPTESGEAEGLDKDEPRDGRRRGANGVIHSDLSGAESKARMTGRADHADGVGKLYNLLYSSSLVLDQTTAWYDCNFLIVEHLLSALEKEVKVANEDLPLAVGNASLHGHLIALRY